MKIVMEQFGTVIIYAVAGSGMLAILAEVLAQISI